ncbi:elongation factor Ts [Patescibacteria group bacterium]|nr:elongation factor Ts [Patescibacteria group bacterium]
MLKELRERTSASFNECRKALEKTNGNLEEAVKLIEKLLGLQAVKKSSRALKAGVIDSYIHGGGNIGVLVEVFSETDFVARNESFKSFAHDIAMHIAAANPLYGRIEDVPEDVVAVERRAFEEETKALNKPSHLITQIVEGKIKSHFEAISLLTQSYVKNPDKTVGEYVNEMIGKFGENIKIGRFCRFEL